MSKWWRVNTYSCTIEPVEVIQETAQFVEYLNPTLKYKVKSKKAGEFFPTFSAARTFLLDRLNSKFWYLDEELTDKVFMMEEPK